MRTIKKKRFFSLLIIIASSISAVLSLLLAFLPYPFIKSFFDSLMSDGTFKSLTEKNATVFRIIFLSISFIWIGCIVVIKSGYLRNIYYWMCQYFLDIKTFVKGLKPTKFNPFSLIILCLVFGSAVILRLVHIYDQFIHDEGYTYTVFSSTSLINTISNYHLPNNHILNSILISFSIHLFGNQPWAVRLPSLLAGFLLIPLTFILASQIFDNYIGLLSSIMVAVLPGAIRYGTIARGYSLVAVFTILSLILAVYVKRNKNLFAWSLLVISCSLGFYSNPVMLFSFGIVFGWLFFENMFSSPNPYNSKLNFIKYWSISGISTVIFVLILYLPVFIYTGADKVFSNPWVSPQPWAGYISYIPNQIKSIWHDWTTGLQTALEITLISGFILSLFLHHKISKVRFPMQVAAFLWIICLVFIQRPEQAPKAWVYLQAPFVMWSAAGLLGIFTLIPVKSFYRDFMKSIIVSCAALVVLMNAIEIVPTIPQRWNEKGPVENTVIAIQSEIDQNDLIIIDAPYDAVVWYYADLYSLPIRYFDKDLPFDRLFVVVESGVGQSLESVLQTRGPDLRKVDLEGSSLFFSSGALDTYLVPHK